MEQSVYNIYNHQATEKVFSPRTHCLSISRQYVHTEYRSPGQYSLVIIVTYFVSVAFTCNILPFPRSHPVFLFLECQFEFQLYKENNLDTFKRAVIVYYCPANSGAKPMVACCNEDNRIHAEEMVSKDQ